MLIIKTKLQTRNIVFEHHRSRWIQSSTYSNLMNEERKINILYIDLKRADCFFLLIVSLALKCANFVIVFFICFYILQRWMSAIFVLFTFRNQLPWCHRIYSMMHKLRSCAIHLNFHRIRVHSERCFSWQRHQQSNTNWIQSKWDWCDFAFFLALKTFVKSLQIWLWFFTYFALFLFEITFSFVSIRHHIAIEC